MDKLYRCIYRKLSWIVLNGLYIHYLSKVWKKWILNLARTHEIDQKWQLKYYNVTIQLYFNKCCSSHIMKMCDGFPQNIYCNMIILYDMYMIFIFKWSYDTNDCYRFWFSTTRINYSLKYIKIKSVILNCNICHNITQYCTVILILCEYKCIKQLQKVLKCC